MPPNIRPAYGVAAASSDLGAAADRNATPGLWRRVRRPPFVKHRQTPTHVRGSVEHRRRVRHAHLSDPHTMSDSDISELTAFDGDIFEFDGDGFEYINPGPSAAG